jgi:Xaa-Pro aminopeptidase
VPVLDLPTDQQRGLLINVERAQALMESRAVDALVAAHPVNVYYFSNFWTVLERMGFDFPSLALYPRITASRPAAAAHTLVVSAAQIWRLVNGDLEHPPNLVAYTAALPSEDPSAPRGDAGEPLASPATPWPFRAGAQLSAIQQRWRSASTRVAGREAASAIGGMVRTLRDAGLARGRIATDDARLGPALLAAGLPELQVVCDPNLFRRLRVVKSAAEVQLMRIAARLNADACVATARQVQDGTTTAEIEALFGIEVSRRGGERVFIVAGSTGGFPHGSARRGEPFLIDAVSHYRHYHGDFGRTVIIGEPDAETLRRVAALRVGWQASFEALRPGRRYSQIRSAGLEAMRRAGYGSYLTVANPHSVGLQHTDEPFRDGPGFNVKDDLLLEENMTLTVDFPHIEVGWGAAHLEDLVLVTRDGAEPLARMDEPLIVV